jgi:1,4-dihydroxy-2-naphthoyl-CoA synthase
LGIAPAYQLAGQAMACNLIDDIAQEGVSAFLEKRKPNWPPMTAPQSGSGGRKTP